MGSIRRKAWEPVTEDAATDPRTQPMQPPSPGPEGAQAFGVIPAGWVLGSDGQRYPENATQGPVPVLRFLLR